MDHKKLNEEYLFDDLSSDNLLIFEDVNYVYDLVVLSLNVTVVVTFSYSKVSLVLS